MRRSNVKLLLIACSLSFDGKTDTEIATELDTHVSAISRWRKTTPWKEFEAELIQTHKQSLLEAQRESVPVANSTP